MKSEDRTLLALLSEALFPDAAAPERSAADERLTEPVVREAVAQTVATLLPLQSDGRYLRSPARAWAGEAWEELLESIVDDIMRSGDFGAKDSERINQAKLMTNGTERTVSGNPIHNLATTFADKATLAWPICGRVKVLLPFGMAYVGMRHAARIARGERPAIHVKSMLTGAEQRRKVYEEFRLFEQE